MMKKKKKEKIYYKYLDIIRVFFCLLVFLYHLNVLKGGFLAVCSFFVLSGYLSCFSFFKKEKVSLKDYYLDRLKKIYLPLIIVVFITVPLVLLLSNAGWISLKPEVNSILLGYNNFWQLNANLDYFARHIDSPFMHLWYMAILLQFEIVFPFIFIGLKKLGEKFHKIVPCIITFIITLVSLTYFCFTSLNGNLMVSYYSTFARSFSLFLGMFLGFFHEYYGTRIFDKLKRETYSKAVFYIYLVILFLLTILVDANSWAFELSMIASSIIACRLISYAITIFDKSMDRLTNVVKSFSSVTYEVYLIQYPVIFLMELTTFNFYIKLIFVIVITIFLSYVLHFILAKDDKYKIFKWILRAIVILLTAYGCFKYLSSKDYSKDLKDLEEQLSRNEMVMQQRQEEYDLKFEEENAKLEKLLKDLEQDESKLKEVVTNLPIVGVGDSVMLGATTSLYDAFPNSYIDAQKSRTAWVINDILLDLKENKKLGNPIIINVGANGDCPEVCKEKIMKTCKGHEVFWLNVTNDSDVHVNKKLEDFAKNHDNLHIIDWATISYGHSDYFIDGIHLTETGKKAYVKAIYEAIYNYYLEDYKLKKEEIINNYDTEYKNKISFYGNGALLNVIDKIQDSYSMDRFVIEKDFNYKTLKERLEKDIQDNLLTNNIIFVLDSDAFISKEKYIELINICKDKKVYILVLDAKQENSFKDLKNVTILDFYQEIAKNSDYLMSDRKHLNEKGNLALKEFLKDKIGA